MKHELKRKSKRGRPKKLRKKLEKRLKLKPRLLKPRAKPLLLSQTRTSTRGVTNRRPIAGTVRSVIFTSKCTETSCENKTNTLRSILECVV